MLQCQHNTFYSNHCPDVGRYRCPNTPIYTLSEVHSKLTMTQRLRAQGEADAVSEVSVKLEALERELTLNTEKIQHAYEAESLKLQHRGVEECRK